MEYRFTLQPYKGPSSKSICPSCGRRSFKLYIDTATGMAVDSTCGICDHIQSCGYHLPPKAFFADHPESRKLSNSQAQRPNVSPMLPTPSKTIPLSGSLMAEYAGTKSSFHTWLSTLGINAENIIHPLGMTPTGEVVFWLIDAAGNLLDGKVIPYGPDGHRVHHNDDSPVPDVNWISTYLKKSKQLDWNTRTRKCFFGENLLIRYPDKPVCIVESEKSAVVMQHFCPAYLWLATGGCTMLNNLDLRPLAERHVTIFPDAGVLTKWKEFFLSQNIVQNYRFYTQLEQLHPETGEPLYEPNTDIVDVLLSAPDRIPPQATTTS